MRDGPVVAAFYCSACGLHTERAGANLPAVIHRELAADLLARKLGQRAMLDLFKPAHAITPNHQLDNFRSAHAREME